MGPFRLRGFFLPVSLSRKYHQDGFPFQTRSTRKTLRNSLMKLFSQISATGTSKTADRKRINSTAYSHELPPKKKAAPARKLRPVDTAYRRPNIVRWWNNKRRTARIKRRSRFQGKLATKWERDLIQAVANAVPYPPMKSQGISRVSFMSISVTG